MLVIGLTLLEGGVPVGIAWVTKLLLDRVASHRVDSSLAWLVAGLGVGILASTVLPHLLTFTQQLLRRRLELSLHDELFASVNQVPGLQIFDQPHFYDLLQLAQQAKDRTPMQLVNGGSALLQQITTLGGFVVSLIALDPVVAGVVLLAGAPGLLVELRLGALRDQFLIAAAPLERRRLFFGNIQIDRCAAQEIRAFGMGDHLRERLLGHVRQLAEHETNRDRREWWLRFSLGLLSAAVAALALLIAVRQAADGQLSVGDVAVVVAGLAALQAGVAGVARTCGQVHEAMLLLEHHCELTSLAAHLSKRPGPAKPVTRLRTGITLQDVWFRYDERLPWVLQGVSFTITAGECVGLVGLNGAGKSTLVKLLLGLLDISRGRVLWDDVDIRDFDPAQLRDRTSVVFQDFMAWDLSARENIGLGEIKRSADTDALVMAAQRAGIHRFLTGLPRGYDTPLSRMYFPPEMLGDDPGVVPSGGQWQRLAVARSLLRADRDLLILDEPSSGLDPESEEGLHERLRYLRTGRASLLISHRLGTVRRADRIVVLEDGQVCEQGTHEQLIKADGRYARLFRLQAHGYRASLTDEPELSTATAASSTHAQ